MADNYLLFAESLAELTPREEAWLVERLTNRDLPTGEDERFDEEECGWFEFEFYTNPAVGRCLKFYAIESGSSQAVVGLVQSFLRRFRPHASFSLSWCASCSKMRDGEFRGGAVFVTAERIETWSSAEWLNERQRAFQECGGSTRPFD